MDVEAPKEGNRPPAAAGAKRGTGRGAFIDSFLTAIDDFYEQVLQNLKPWIAVPPRLRSVDEPVVVEAVAKSLVSTAISSQDGPEAAAALSAEPFPEPGDAAAVVDR